MSLNMSHNVDDDDDDSFFFVLDRGVSEKFDCTEKNVFLFRLLCDSQRENDGTSSLKKKRMS